MGAKANRTYIASIKEATWGDTPGTPAFQKINFTGESLNFEIDTTTPETIRDDRMVTDNIQVSAGATGGYEFEMQAIASGPNDEHLLGALWAEEWLGDSTPFTAVGVVITAATRTLDVSGPGSTTWAIGQKVVISGSTEGNDGVYTVESQTAANAYVMIEAFTSDETMSAGNIYQTEYARNGLFQHSFSMLRGHEDVSEYFLYTGMVVNEFTLNIEAGEVLTGGYTFVGKDNSVAQTVPDGATFEDPPLTDFMSAGFSVSSIMINGAPIDDCLLMSLELNINNNVEGKMGVGNVGYCNVADGEFGLDGAIVMYFNDSTMYQRFRNNEAFSVSFAMSDDAGNYYIVTLPKVKLSEDAVNAEGKNEDVMDNAAYVALMDETTNCMIQIDRVII